MPVPVIIDCDPGWDDALALMLALSRPDRLDVRAVTCVGGNGPLAETTANARALVGLCGRHDVVTYAGCEARPTSVDWARIPELPALAADAVPGQLGAAHAVEVIAAAAGDPSAALTLIAIAPLTNVAAALAEAGSDGIAAIAVMGGTRGPGNATPYAEFNFHADPAAAAVVLQAPVTRRLVTLEAATPAGLADSLARHLAAGRSRLAAAARRILAARLNGGGGAVPPLGDLLAVAHVLEPTLFGSEPAPLAVDVSAGERGGALIAAPAGTPPTDLLTLRDPDGFCALFAAALDGAAAE